jgi:hypothetical protein
MPWDRMTKDESCQVKPVETSSLMLSRIEQIKKALQLQGFFDLYTSVPFIIKLIGLRRIK